MRSVAAEWAAQAVASGTPEFAELASLIQTHFGTRDISVIDSEALTAHLEDLLEEGVVRIDNAGKVPYWSASVYDRSGQNIYSFNDRTATDRRSMRCCT